jgi:hypothetical protein
MALEILRVPSFEYSGFYFPQIAARLRRWARINAPEITNEDLREVFVQLERAFALMAHYNNVLIDMVANDMFLETARLPESIRLLLELINYRLLPASPAQVDLLGKLARTYTTTTQLLQTNRKFATRRTPDEPEIVFENTEAFNTTARTDQITDAYTLIGLRNEVIILSSLEPDIIRSDGNFVTADLGRYIRVVNSVAGNETDDLRITELLEQSGPGVYDKVRVEEASFVSESTISLVCTISDVSVNHAADLNSGTPVALFSTPSVNDKFFFGHADVMFDRFDVELDTVALGLTAVWEFYDPSETTFQPDSVVIDPAENVGTTKFVLTGLLGVENRYGALVRIVHVPSGNEAKQFSIQFGGENVVYVTGYFDQDVPSTNIGDYLIFLDWRPIDTIEDTTKTTGVTWAQDGRIVFNVPQTRDDNWQKYSLFDSSAGQVKEGYFIRYRITDASGGPTGPTPELIEIDKGDQYVMPRLIQGKTVEDDPLGSSSGEADQEFTLTRSPYIANSIQVFVDEGGGDIEWEEVTTFLTSLSSDRHFVVNVQTDGTAIVVFGSGTNGRIPPLGTNNIRALYRIGGGEDGNIGANTLTVNRDGAGVFREVTNPRAGEFWVEADWNSQESLERVKQDGPLTLRTMLRAVTARDAEILARAFQTEDGVKPVERARAYEEAFGPKTIELVVAGRGGAALSSVNRGLLEDFFNGSDEFGGILVVNHELTVTNYVPRLIGYTMTVTANEVVTEALVLQALQGLISPSAVEDDRVTYVWGFGQEVPHARVISEIFKISPGNVFNVEIASPTVDVTLASRELPLLDVVNTNVVIVPPSF